ncbi:DEAD/DEAH box helicase [Jiangella gansuensis]|uniref:DEAD/DEAH box helicase n=1 Tax=Jiangella gansuensis TaxID=281473 RepID=UPI0004AD3A3C|nr:DEAD/DEAH box helicase [Jiangella gansuensis]
MWTNVPAEDDLGLRAVVGPSAYVRGLMYAQQGAVSDIEWDPARCMFTGKVIGSRRDPYVTAAVMDPLDDATYTFAEGYCTCPVKFDCKHVVALLIAAVSDERPTEQPTPEPAVPAWTRALDSLLGDDGTGQGRDDDAVPLAVELSLYTPRTSTRRRNQVTQPQLRARVVRPGQNGWVAGQLSWSGLRQPYGVQQHRADQVQWLRQFYTLHQAGRQASAFFPYYQTEEKYLDLTAFESSQLWPMLDEAALLGIRLVHRKKSWGDIDGYRTARLSLDVTKAAESGDLVIAPTLAVDGVGEDVVPVRFIGDDAHGLVYASRADAESGTDSQNWRFGLARFDRPVDHQLQTMVLDGNPLTVPASDGDRFRDEYAPRLHRLVTVESSDGSFAPPDLSGPRLVVRADYDDDHALDLHWEWLYSIGDQERRYSLGVHHEDDEFRDRDAERALLASVDAELDGIELSPGETDEAIRRLTRGFGDQKPSVVSRRRLDGLDTMRFSTEAVRRLEDLTDVDVEVTGDPADYREVGDSVVIGVSTEASPGETDWFDLGVTITVEGQDVPFVDVFSALSRDEPYLLLPDGAYFSVQKPELQALRKLIEEARALGESTSTTTRISRFQAGLWEELMALGIVTSQADAWRRQVQGLLTADSFRHTQPPSTLLAELRPYQLDGYRWLTFLWEHGLGGILADDMGLGKTVQALALMCHAKQTVPGGAPFLVVAPTSVVSNWVAEAARFAPGLSVVPVTDTLRRRGQSIDDVIDGADVVVTTYTLMRLDADAYAQVSWSGVMFDEAQHVKNHQSKTYQSARKLPAAFKLAITGTPVENNLMELWSQLSLTAPGLFPSPSRFEQYYARPVERRADTGLLAQLRRRIRPLVLRRTKDQVVTDLPAKQEQVTEVELHPAHRKVYEKHLQRERQKVLGLLDDIDKNRFTILRSLTLLRQLSLHAGLVDPDHAGLPSAKIGMLLEQLREVVDGGHRALVFSQFTGFLGVVREHLGAAGIDYCYLDGSTRHREQVIASFKDGMAPVFLISLKAGGFGLNLTEADYCFLLDPWWNPATEAQAVDRTHRIGQTRNVMVYRLIAADTIEQKVMALKARKADLSASVMDDGNLFGSSLGIDDIRDLLQ